MKHKLTNRFDALISSSYGTRRGKLRSIRDFESLLTDYYGKALALKQTPRRRSAAMLLSLNYDTNELLKQEPQQQSLNDDVVQPMLTDTGFEEYVLTSYALSEQRSIDRSSSLTEQVSATDEYELDVQEPLPQRAKTAVQASTYTPLSSALLSQDQHIVAEQPIVISQAASAHAESNQAHSTADDFMADLQSILTGQKVFDPFSKKTVEKNHLEQIQSLAQPRPAQELPVAEAHNSQAIFDRIAQSMQYANAYDLGTVELQHRLADFDKIAELEERATAAKKSKHYQASTTPSSPNIKTDSADFLRDMDTMRQQHSSLPSSSNTTEALQSSLSIEDNMDPAIELLNLADIAKKAAYALKKNHPDVIFTSGRRSIQEQAQAMAANVIQNRQWIEQTYASSSIRDACQTWVNDHSEKQTKDEIAQGLAELLSRYTDEQLGSLSKHISGMAFDIQAVEAGAEGLKQSIRNLDGLDKFLEQEGGLVRWHAQFK